MITNTFAKLVSVVLQESRIKSHVAQVTTKILLNKIDVCFVLLESNVLVHPINYQPIVQMEVCVYKAPLILLKINVLKNFIALNMVIKSLKFILLVFLYILLKWRNLIKVFYKIYYKNINQMDLQWLYYNNIIFLIAIINKILVI